MHGVGRLNSFHGTGLFLYSLKTSDNQKFSYTFMEYRKNSVTANGLIAILLQSFYPLFDFKGKLNGA